MKRETRSYAMSLCQCGCPEVSLAWADHLPLIACLCVLVCVCVCKALVRVPVPLPCSVSAVCLCCRASGEYRALLDPVTVSVLHQKNLDPSLLLCSNRAATQLTPHPTRIRLQGVFILIIFHILGSQFHFNVTLPL